MIDIYFGSLLCPHQVYPTGFLLTTGSELLTRYSPSFVFIWISAGGVTKSRRDAIKFIYQSTEFFGWYDNIFRFFGGSDITVFSKAVIVPTYSYIARKEAT